MGDGPEQPVAGTEPTSAGKGMIAGMVAALALLLLVAGILLLGGGSTEEPPSTALDAGQPTAVPPPPVLPDAGGPVGDSAPDGTAAINTAGDIKQILDGAAKAFEDGRFDETLRLTDQALGLSPGHEEAVSLKKRAEAEQNRKGVLREAQRKKAEGKVVEAYGLFKKIPETSRYHVAAQTALKELKGPVLEAHFRRARQFARGGKTEEAAEEYRRILTIEPGQKQARKALFRLERRLSPVIGAPPKRRTRRRRRPNSSSPAKLRRPSPKVPDKTGPSKDGAAGKNPGKTAGRSGDGGGAEPGGKRVAKATATAGAAKARKPRKKRRRRRKSSRARARELTHLGHRLAAREEYEAAQEKYLKAIRMDRSYAQAYHGAGTANVVLGKCLAGGGPGYSPRRCRQAVRYYREYLRLRPGAKNAALVRTHIRRINGR